MTGRTQSEFVILREALDLLNEDATGYKAKAVAELETLFAERDQAKWEIDQIAELRDQAQAEERRWYEIFHREMVRADNAQQALGAVKAWLQQEEEVGLGVPDILWDTILGAMSNG